MLKLIKKLIFSCSLVVFFTNSAHAEGFGASGTWKFNVGSKPYIVRLQSHTYPSEVAPISGTITTPEKQSITINKCSDQQIASGGNPPYISYLDGKWPAECSYINGDPSGFASVIVLRTSLKFVWIFTINNGKANGAIFDRTNGKKIFTISGQKIN